ncbi:MAG: DUF4314 domain-containing protein [Lachnospiraceae bacterium]|nr:DUF4314 domain-containing protein [Lachnospiraceae bacterium]
MNEYERLSRQAKVVKEDYPPGTRIMLLAMEDPFAPVPSGTRGTVKFVDDIGQLHMSWDNGRSLSVVPGEDSFRKLTDKEQQNELRLEAAKEENKGYNLEDFTVETVNESVENDEVESYNITLGM